MARFIAGPGGVRHADQLIDVESNAIEVESWIRDLFRDQIPFATSRAINDTAWGIVREERRGLEQRFTIRRQWVLSGVRVRKRSHKNDRPIEAEVWIDPSRDFLFKFEEGGTIHPRGSRFAVPDEARRTGTGVVSRTERPRSLEFEKWGSGPGVEVYRGKKRTWMIRRSDGTGAIFKRLGRRGNTRLRMLFSFTPEADIDELLQFELTAKTVFQETFDQNFDHHFNRAMRTAR